MDNINFKKVLDDGELFDQQANYEENFEKINQLVVPKITDLETNKVDKVAGKGLSTNDFDNTYKQKIDVDIPAQLNEKALKAEVGTLTNLLTIAKTSIVAAINELFNNKANKAQESWLTPTLLNGATFDSSDPLRYRKNDLGRVEFKGKVVIINSSICFEMPSGYRVGSGKTRRFPIIRDGSTVTLVSILNNQVYPVIGNLDFSGISYVAEA